MEESKVSEESRIYINWEETNGVTGGGDSSMEQLQV